jgi:hypothetical protein
MEAGMPIRVKYFDRQFLRVEEFTAEQDYHVNARRRLNRGFQGSGVAEGLDVTTLDAGHVSVGSGMAIDPDGREIVLDADTPVKVSGAAPGATIYVTAAYEEVDDANSADRQSPGAPELPTRRIEQALLKADASAPVAADKAITLASFKLNDQGQVPGAAGASLGSDGRGFAGARQLSGSATARGDLAVLGNLSLGGTKSENSEG